MTRVPIPVPLPLRDIVPPPELFWFSGRLHGQRHVARVTVHAFHLVQVTGATDEAVRLWAAVYLHDLARTDDSESALHGRDACGRLDAERELKARLFRGGVTEADLEGIKTAVRTHSDGEVPEPEPYWRLTALLKDADALDRVRLGDLDVNRLRHPDAKNMVPFAERLWTETVDRIPESPDHFEQLWPEALRILESCS